MLNTENIQALIDSGEGYNVEFKVRVPSKVRELTEEICAFANADGGHHYTNNICRLWHGWKVNCK
ncbi:AlbA family DNA-binding domain-containing protein [Bacteroides fluxus]|uniref:Uncharacterized protein n=1 Tax=Bacteroides fluxus YIT 12057 TaxID=763034 RepID=F3PW94_9BACE|nr:hypothetical protein HMPREF9446_03028 [Bacteroides fluxus YIT 12057]